MNSESVEALRERAQTLLQHGNLGETVEAYQRLLAVAPGDADSWFNLGYLQRRLQRYDEALASYARAIDLGMEGAEEAHLNRGTIYSNALGEPDKAEAEFRAALALKPDYLEAMQNLGNVHEDRGEKDEARAMYERILSVVPYHPQALARVTSLLDGDDSEHPTILRTRWAISQLRSHADRADLGFALGRALDKAKSYDSAFTAYSAANRDNRVAAGGRYPEYDLARVEAEIDALVAAFPAPAPVPERFDDGETAPVFICGMFRSGSTLAETMIGAHSKVTAGGELPFIHDVAGNAPQPYPQALASASHEELARLRARYFTGLRRLIPSGLVTDKRPDNFLHIGLIKRIMPEAKIIHTRRDAMDNCLSIFFLHLDPAMTYAHDLETIAHWYRLHDRLMDHWKSLWPEDIHEVDYDAMVADPKPELEKLLAFCRLDWEDGVLDFHEAQGTVRTASAWQVREPLYQRSSGRWRNYDKHLEPLKAALGLF